MASYKGHILFGVIFVLIIWFINYFFDLFKLSSETFLFSMPLLFVYSILPDIDISSSKIRKVFTSVALLFVLFSILLNYRLMALAVTLTLLLLQFVKHRKFFHTITAAILFSLPLILFDYVFALLAFIGYFSHLMLDGEIKLI